jgi:hypothetical protein
VVCFLSVIILLLLGVLIHFHRPITEATLLSKHVIAKSTTNNTRQKSATPLNLQMAKLIISNSRHLMKCLFKFIRGKNAVILKAE